MWLHSHKNKKYVIRQSIDSSNTIKNFVKSCENDIFITEFLNERAAKTLRESDYLVSKESDKVGYRLVKIVLPTGEIEVLATNVLDLTIEELAVIYRLRWSIETLFFYLKEVLYWGVFSGYDSVAILQDLWSTVIFYNLQSIFINDAKHTLESKPKNKEKPYKINRAVGASILKRGLRYLFSKKLSVLEKFCNRLISNLLRHTEKTKKTVVSGVKRNNKKVRYHRHGTEKNYKHNFG